MKLLILIAAVVATPVLADELRDLCPDRPGRVTPPCIIDKGHLLIETGVASFEHDAQPDTVTDTLTLGNFTGRFGVTDRLEVLAQWSAYNRVETRDRATGLRDFSHGVGDLLFGFKYSLAHPDGKGLSVAVQPFATAPTAKSDIGAGRWTEGVIVPASLDIGKDWQVGISPEIDRLPNSLGDGHHAAYTMVTSLVRSFGPFSLGGELWASRDEDPGNRTTQATADLLLARSFGDNLQLDAEADAGLTHATPDIRVQVGISRRF